MGLAPAGLGSVLPGHANNPADFPGLFA